MQAFGFFFASSFRGRCVYAHRLVEFHAWKKLNGFSSNVDVAIMPTKWYLTLTDDQKNKKKMKKEGTQDGNKKESWH